jgi:hypothetical protein
MNKRCIITFFTMVFILVFLANNSYDVYTMDYRTVNIPDMDYDQFSDNNVDISPNTEWTNGVFREEVRPVSRRS